MKAKLKTYVLMLAKQFPAHHYKKGDSTQFYGKCLAGTKIHTIRINAELWKKRIDEVNAGRAIISVREWSGKPYEKGSNQPELFQMHKCGYEFIEKSDTLGKYIVNSILGEFWQPFSHNNIQSNDGLERDEFDAWFKKINTREQLIIIHFTDFRYTNETDGISETYLIPMRNGMRQIKIQ